MTKKSNSATPWIIAACLAIALAGMTVKVHPPVPHSSADRPPVKLHGEPMAGNDLSAAGNAVPAAGPPARLRHPKPASTQRRMVLAQLAEATNSDAAMPSGTAGNALDLSRTNLPAAKVSGMDVSVPGHENIDFSLLAGFDFPIDGALAGTNAAPAAAQALGRIPSTVRALDGRKIVIEGFLLPVLMDSHGLTVEFLLMRNQSMCCYGVAPKINEWISVRAGAHGVKPVMDQPIAVAGMLRVRPVIDNGGLAGIYQMDADKIIAPF